MQSEHSTAALRVGPAAAPAPRGAIPNWQPATTPADYLRNCDEGLEEYSSRRFAQLMGWPRIRLHRARLMVELPDDLFERLLAARVHNSKALANIALAFRQGSNTSEVERCPHCGGVTRVRRLVSDAAREAITGWLDGAAL